MKNKNEAYLIVKQINIYRISYYYKISGDIGTLGDQANSFAPSTWQRDSWKDLKNICSILIKNPKNHKKTLKIAANLFWIITRKLS